MTSPFPGMDPYLEDPAFWPDFHITFLYCWREAIANQLPAMANSFSRTFPDFRITRCNPTSLHL